jgi:hypothetical protein
VEGCKDKGPNDPDSWDGLYGRIMDFLMTRFAASVAPVIASVPSLQAAVAAYVASTPDNDP